MFSVRLKNLRKSKKSLTQSDMAAYLGIAKTTYASYEQGKRMPDIEIQLKIADYFNVSLDYLHDHEFSDKDINDDLKELIALLDDDIPKEIIKDVINYAAFNISKNTKKTDPS